MVDFPKIEERCDSEDGTRRYLLRLGDERSVESVVIPRTDRLTFCISSQIGCSLGCAFCLTGQLGLVRNLSSQEIVSQVTLLERECFSADAPGRRFSVVLMGMGEPLDNYDNVFEAIRILHDDRGLRVPLKRITVSTAGLVPAIRRLAAESFFPNLCISITGFTNRTRDLLMPVNRKYAIETVIDAVREFPRSRQKRVMFECVMIKDQTDEIEDAREFARLIEGMPVKVNLIPLNPAAEISFERSPDEIILRVQNTFMQYGITTFIRKNRGNDVLAACGQLRATRSQTPSSPVRFQAIVRP